METLIKIQNELKVPKGNFNSFGKYKYRSAEDILEAVKPLLLKYKATMVLSDDIVAVGVKMFLKATAAISIDDGKGTWSICGFAELGEHKGMSSEQTTGTASSYARKYALNGLFLIDETQADPDSQKPEVKKETPKQDLVMLTEDQFLKAMDSDKKGILATLTAYNGQNGKGMTPDQTKQLTAQMANVK